MPATGTSPEQQASLHALWDSLADFGQGDIDRAWRHLLEEMCGLLHADNAMWAGVVRLSHPSMSDPLGGWRMPVVKYLRPLPGETEGEIAVGGLDTLQPARARDGFRKECDDHAENDDPVRGLLGE